MNKLRFYQMEQPNENLGKKRDFLLPASILIAGLLVSISLVYSIGKKNTNDKDLIANVSDSVQPSSSNVKPVTNSDHIFGDPNAPIKIIEFSDLECPYCKNFHLTMKKVVDSYNGKVAWIYRHFPLDIHPKAVKEAQAVECAAEIGGNQAFWAYMDRLFEITPSNNGLDLNELPKIAEFIGLDKAKFQSCLDDQTKNIDLIQSNLDDAISSGARGTPYSIVVAANGKKFVIPGAFPFEPEKPNDPSVKEIIEQALQ